MSQLDLTRQALVSTSPGDGVPPRAWRTDEPWRIDLGGAWRFHHAASLADAPDGCDAVDFDDSGWDELPVPSHWVLTDDGRFGRPIYTNIQLPIPFDPPFVPDDNAIGDHRRTFELPAEWADLDRVLLRFDGVESLGIVAVNGEHVGVLRGSRLPSELDVTDVVVPGTNTIHVRVAQWSAQTYVEDQDQWWLPGIFRDVALIGRPAGGIDDHWVRADFDHTTGTGTLSLEVTGAAFPLRVHVPALAVDVTWPEPTDVAPIEVPDVTPWSPDRPQLYDLELSNDVETVHTRVGFRTVEIRGDQWLVNGIPIRIRGVNRHEYHPRLGRVFDEDAARDGLLEMKRHNINAVRTSHYPPHPRFLDLCDELGFWVMDECDLETHAFHLHGWDRNPTDDPVWHDALLDRMARMIARDRNHPSIICWSVGNEAGTGANSAAMTDLAHRVDPTRPVHYEPDYEADHSDVVSRMYPSLLEMRAISAGTSSAYSPRPMQAARMQGKPKILCEYVHAMGNGSGAVREYVELFEELHDWHGGFIWEWRDHGIATTTPHGTEYFAYGGDFGEHPNDGNFVMDGMVHADGTPSPMMAEVKQLYSPVVVEIGDDHLSVENRFHAVDTSHLLLRWRWEVDGEPRDAGEFHGIVVAAGERETFDLPALPAGARSLPESFLTVEVVERDDRPWAPAGHVLCTAQRRLDDAPTRLVPAPTSAPVVADVVRVGPASLCPHSGRLLAIDDLPITDASVELWRAPTDNDSMSAFGSYEVGDYAATLGKGAPAPSSADRWRKQGLDRLMRRTVSARVEDDEFVVVERLMGAQARHGAEVTFRWRAVDGAAACRVLVTPIRPRTDTTWPRIGVHLVLPGGFDDAVWFGGGPHEAYPDSRAASVVARHESAIDELAFPYAMPQETGHREALRRLTISGEEGTLHVEAFGPDLPGFSLLRHSAQELARARHQHELAPSHGLHLYLDAFQHGLGSRACGPDVLPEYQLWPRKAEFGFLLSTELRG